MSLLLDTNVTDLILRAQMYRDIIADIESGELQTTSHEIATDEVMRSDLISFRAFGRADLSWLVDLLTNREDIALPHQVAAVIVFPSQVYLREKIKQYATLESDLAND